MDDRPLFLFDFGAREAQETLRTRLLLEAEICLANSGKPVRKMVEDLRAYIVKNKSSDARIYPILRIIHKYVNVTPTDFRDLVDILGTEKALHFIDGVRPPAIVWRTFKILSEEGCSDDYLTAYWNGLLDLIEGGETNIYAYTSLAHKFRYTNRNLRPGDERIPARR